jgi:hypothetical protein
MNIMKEYTLITKPDDISEAEFITSAIESLSAHSASSNLMPIVLSHNSPNIYIIRGLKRPAEDFGYETPTRSLTAGELRALRAELDKGNTDALYINPRMLVANPGMNEDSTYTKRVSELSATEFEQHIAKVFKAIEEKGAKVTWNSTISDPFTPKQKRQIDVLIEKDGKRIHVECRHRGRRQNVNWIEELVGKGHSQKADLMIGISSSGFTEGAINTAKGLGVRLKEIGSIDKNGELWWTEGMIISTAKFKLQDIKLTFHTKGSQIPEYHLHMIDRITEKGAEFWDAFTFALDEFSNKQLAMEVFENRHYLFNYSIDPPKDYSDIFSKIDVSTTIQYFNLTATRVDSHTLNDLSQEIDSLDAVIENREMLGWKMDVISTEDKLKFICSRIEDDQPKDEYISSAITIEEVSFCDKEVTFEIEEQKKKTSYFAHTRYLQYSNGQITPLI